MIFLTGSTGFVGRSIIDSNQFGCISYFKRGDILNFDKVNAVLHLAGKAHDLKNTSTPDEYYQANTEFTKKIFDTFLSSDAKVFITLSSVKALADKVEGVLTEDFVANPITHYGKSKFLAEEYVLSKEISEGKRVYVLRPCMIHGPGNKGNLNLLFNLVSKGLPWPLGAFENKRSFCSIENLLFVLKELIENDNIPSGIYNIADDQPLSTNELIQMMAKSQGKKAKIWNISKSLISSFYKVGDTFNLPISSERLQKLTDSYVVSNAKLVKALGKPLPVSSKDGLMTTFNSFNS